ncbi:MAG: cytochrome c [Acidobacteriota bacterium]
MKKSLVGMSLLGVVLSAGMLLGQGKGKGGAGNAAKGKELFESNCSVCHNSDSDERKMGPGLKGVSKHEKLANGKAPTDANVIEFLNAGGNGMPGFADLLTGAEKADILAFLKSL